MEEVVHNTETRHRWHTVLVVVLLVACAGGVGYGWYIYDTRVSNLERELATTTQKLIQMTTRAQQTSEELTYTEEMLRDTAAREAELGEQLRKEELKNRAFEEQIEDLSGTIGKLDKLAKTDPELLKKYSKVYFLSENYIPEKLVRVDEQYVENDEDLAFIHAKVEPYLEDMVEAAEDDNVKLRVVSAYRSYDEQLALKKDYSVTYGSGANAFSADQGYSEHQLGTTIDLTTEGINGNIDQFGETEAFEWMRENAYKYGFVLSYPENNNYYIYEPWHWRFVGKDLARDLHREGKNFYDLDQREIDEYLIELFD